MPNEAPSRCGCSSTSRRRGSATLWMVIWLPCLLALFCVLVGVANLWLARIELENALESAALAAVKEWGDACGGDTSAARQVGVNYARANSVRGIPAELDANYGDCGTNQNGQCQAATAPGHSSLIFGEIETTSAGIVVFDAGATSGSGRFGVRAQAMVPVQPLGFVPFLGSVSKYCVQAKATAGYDFATRRPRLVRIDAFVGP